MHESHGLNEIFPLQVEFQELVRASSNGKDNVALDVGLALFEAADIIPECGNRQSRAQFHRRIVARVGFLPRSGCPRECVRDRFSHHALTNLSSNLMANWVLASHNSRGGIFHVCATGRKTRCSNLIAASSAGKCLSLARAPQPGKDRVGRLAALAADAPRFATRSRAHATNGTPAQKPLVDLIRDVNDAPHSDGKGEELDDMLPVSPPALGDCRILTAADAGVEILQRPAGHVRVRRPDLSRALTPSWRSRNRCRNCRMLSSRFAGIPISSSTIDEPGVPQLLNRGSKR